MTCSNRRKDALTAGCVSPRCSAALVNDLYSVTTKNVWIKFKSIV